MLVKSLKPIVSFFFPYAFAFGLFFTTSLPTFNSSAAGDWVNCGICGEWAHFGCDRRQGLGAFKVNWIFLVLICSYNWNILTFELFPHLKFTILFN